MARSFLTTDVLTCPSFSSPTALTLMGWAKDPLNLANQPRMFVHNTNNTLVFFLGAGDFRFQRDFNTTDGIWTVTVANHGATIANWNHWAIVHDGTTAAPLIYVNGVSKTVTTTTTPVGTVVTTSAAFLIGNNTVFNRPFGGSLAHAAMVGRQLTAGEIAMHMQTGFVDNAALMMPIWGDSTEPDLSGNKRNGTITGTTVTANPPTLPRMFPVAWRMREEYTEVAATGQPMALRHTLDRTGARSFGRGIA